MPARSRAALALVALAALGGAGCRPAVPAPAPTRAADASGAAMRAAPADSFANPVVSSQDAGDPWVVRHGDAYYFTATLDANDGVWVWRSPTLTGLDSGRKVKVWDAPESGPTSAQIWAPELHRLRGKWYLYFTASDGVDANHRHYVLEAETDDPQGPYKPPIRIEGDPDRWAIDASVLEMPDGRLYFMYCGRGLYIAPMSSPTRVSGPPVLIHAGSQEWERGWRRAGDGWERAPGYWVEAPEPLIRDGRVFIVYSAGHTATPHYYLGLLTLVGDDPMDPRAWSARPEPLLGPYEGPDGAVYTPGHNGFATSPDGTEDWLVYHAKDRPWPVAQGRRDVGSRRTVRIQRFTWNADGTPNFGRPIPSGVRLRKPSGE